MNLHRLLRFISPIFASLLLVSCATLAYGEKKPATRSHAAFEN